MNQEGREQILDIGNYPGHLQKCLLIFDNSSIIGKGVVMRGEVLTKKTKGHYDKIADKQGVKYEWIRWHSGKIQKSHYLHTKKSIGYAFSKLSNVLGNADELLEVGCATGVWTDICLKYSKRLTLFDISDKMIELVKDKYKNESNIRYICGDFVKDKIDRKDFFDIVFSSRAIEYMSNKEHMIKKCFYYLKPGGYLILITKNPLWQDKVINNKRKKNHFKQNKNDIQTDWIYWKDLQQLFVNNGFNKIKIRPVALGSYYPPFNNIFGVKLCNLIQRLIYNKEMRPQYNFISESYLIMASKQYEIET